MVLHRLSLFLVVLYSFLPDVFSFRHISLFKVRSISTTNVIAETLKSSTPVSDSNTAFIEQKNRILLERFLLPNTGNLTEVVKNNLNFFDENFNVFLDEKVAQAISEEEKQQLGKIRYEINVARRQRLIDADSLLRDILSAGGLKQMEAKMNNYLRRGEIDMAFRVILQLNIEDAIVANVTTAVQIMKHLETMINEYQDAIVSPPVHLLRLLLREDDIYVRKQMLRQKLLIGRNIERVGQPPSFTTTPQCENIIVNPVDRWGGPDVSVEEFNATIDDIVSQVIFNFIKKFICQNKSIIFKYILQICFLMYIFSYSFSCCV